jgi:hypothetical protein
MLFLILKEISPTLLWGMNFLFLQLDAQRN